jgi:hypothetical protein
MSEEVKDILEDIQETTKVEQADVDIDAMFGPGADNIMLPEDTTVAEKKPSFFSKKNTNLDFLDKESEVEHEEVDEDSFSKSKNADGVVDELNDLINQEEEKGNAGRPSLSKDGLADLAAKMIEEGTLIPFEDDKDISDYSVKDFRELFEANFTERENKMRASIPNEFFQSLPQELQVAAKYVADGGQDLKGLFKTLSQVHEIVELSPDNEEHQSEIARQYLYATRFGTAEEIEQQIEEWEDIGKLGAKSAQFKPKLDKMQESIISNKLAQQEQAKQQQEQVAKMYMDNVYDVLATGELAGVKLDKKIQGMLYSGLVQPNYPSISGKPTNLLGHLLEKYQFVEPRHDLIAEALWLLQDPDGYKSKIKEQGGKTVTEKTVRMLKTEEQRKNTSSNPNEDPNLTERKSPTKRTLSRNPGNMFKR